MTLLDLPLDETAAAEHHPGQWRLSEIEVVNWGTFDGAHRIDVARKGHLITGASGSGKSSLLDAIAAVLTPERWLRFNAAAQDASSRGTDRGLVSYVRGAWSKEADEFEDRAVSTYLRSKATWSGIRLRYDTLQGEPVNLVRLFHLPGTSTSRGDLKDALLLLRSDVSLMELKEFVASGIEVRKLKARFPDAQISSSGHGAFYSRVRRVFGITSDNAFHLLHKTQSAKNLGNLDHLFRSFMLDRPATFDQARNASEQFRELNTAHEHVIELRDQAIHLDKLAGVVDEFEREGRTIAEVQRLLAAQEVFQDRFHLEITESDRADLVAARARHEADANEARALLGEAERVLHEARLREANLGGADAGLLRARIDDARADIARVQTAAARLAGELRGAGIDAVPGDGAEFAELQESARTTLAEPADAVDHALHDAYAAARRAVERLDAELTALKHRRSNIDARLLAAREWLCQELGVSEQALPFGGELIDVLPEYAEWTGAIERVLHPLASALLVRDSDLRRIRRLIDGRNLGARFVIEAVPPETSGPRPARAEDSVLSRVRVADGPFAEWLGERLSYGFDISCVNSPDDLDRVERGVTIGGQIKTGKRRYEKNDRYAVGDRSKWILGSNNQAKVDHLLEQRSAAQRELEAALATFDAAQQRAAAGRSQRDLLGRVLAMHWEEFDEARAESVLAEREADLARLTTRSGELEAASAAVSHAEQAKADRDAAWAASNSELAVTNSRLAQADELADRLTTRLAGRTVDDTDTADLRARYRSVQRKIDGTNIAEIGQKVATALRDVLDASAKQQGRSRSDFARLAASFQSKWPAAAPSLTADIDDAGGYRALLDGIRGRGLPEHEENFRKLLREKSRDLMGLLLSEIRDAPKQIEERVDPVNASLGRSLFDVDRFLRIRVKTKRSPEATAFIANLKGIVDGSWDQSDDRVEERFAALKHIMDRLESAENGNHSDAAWRQRCLDTREHVTFQAQEVDRTGTVVSVHDSSDGLSGGQRQKLVIFCLAAALRYQLTDDDQGVPSYGTIVLDEAFDKADSQYTRMAMDVFTEFGFHMILATPQKLLQTIEGYIGAVTSVSNPTRKQSLLANVPFVDEDAPRNGSSS